MECASRAPHDVLLVAAGCRLRTLSKRDPLELLWKESGVEFVFGCTGAFTRREDLEKHIRAVARFVLLSAPSKGKENGEKRRRQLSTA